MRVTQRRKPFGHAGNADIPGDVAHKFALGQAEIAEPLRQQPPVMVAGKQERRGACRVAFVHRRDILAVEEQ